MVHRLSIPELKRYDSVRTASRQGQDQEPSVEGAAAALKSMTLNRQAGELC
jgi:hypothetical protein